MIQFFLYLFKLNQPFFQSLDVLLLCRKLIIISINSSVDIKSKIFFQLF